MMMSIHFFDRILKKQTNITKDVTIGSLMSNNDGLDTNPGVQDVCV